MAFLGGNGWLVVIKYLKKINSIQKFETKSFLLGDKSPTSISESSFFNGLKRLSILVSIISGMSIKREGIFYT